MSVDNDTIAQRAREEAQAFMAEKEATAKAAQMEANLLDAKNKLNELASLVEKKNKELEAANEASEGLEAQIEQLNAKVAEMTASLEESLRVAEEFKGKAEEAEASLAALALEATISDRVSQLQSASVAKAGDKLESQIERIKVMSDEEFATYKEELVEVRAEVKAELELAMATANDADSGDDKDQVATAAAEIKGSTKELAGIVVETDETKNTNRFKALASFVGDELKKTNNEE